MKNRKINFVVVGILILFAMSTFPKIKSSLPYVLSNDEIYIVDQAVGYSTGDFSRGIGGITNGYGDFPIILKSFGIITHKFIYVINQLFIADVFNVKTKSRDDLIEVYAKYQEINHEYYVEYFLNPNAQFLISRSISLIFALLSLYVVFRISCLFIDKKWSLLVLVFTSILPVFHVFSSDAKVEMALTFTSLAFVFFTLKAINTKKEKYFFLSGMFCGLAMCSKQNALFLIIPFVYFIYTLYKYFKRDQIPSNKLLFYSFGGFGLAFMLFGPNYFFNSIAILIKQVVFALMVIGRDHPIFNNSYGIVLLNGFFEFGIVFALFVIAGIFVFCKNIKNELRFFILIYLISMCLPFIFNYQFVSSMYILPTLPIFTLLGIYTFHHFYHLFKINARIKNVVLFLIIIGATFPLITEVYNEVYSSINANSDTRIAAKDWIEKNIAKDNKLYYLGKFTFLPPLRSKNRIPEDRRHDEKFNQSLKIHFDKFISNIADSNFYYIEEVSDRFFVKKEFEELLNIDYLFKNDIKYCIYAPAYFKRYHAKGFEYQKNLIDNMVLTIEKKSILMKEFISGGDIVNGPTIKIYKMIY